MLTKTDLKAIDKVLDQKLDQKLEEKFEVKLEPIKKDIKSLKSDVAKIRKDVSTIVSFFNREYLDLRRRVERIEEHLRLPPL